MLSVNVRVEGSWRSKVARAIEWIQSNDWIENVTCNHCELGNISWFYSARKKGLVSVNSLVCPSCNKQINIQLN